MTSTALTQLDLRPAEMIAEELPNHAAALASYEAAGLEPRDAFMLEAHAARIITIGRQGILSIGQELLQARERAQHGTWSAFLQRAGVEERTALNYMRVVERFGDKPEIISDFSPTALYAMAAPSADPQVVDAIVEEVRAGGSVPKVEEVKQRLAPPKPTPPALTPRPAAPPPRPDDDDEEIAAPTPPRPAPPPLVLTPLAAAPAAGLPQQAKITMLVKRELLLAAVRQLELEIARAGGDLPEIVIGQQPLDTAARMFLANPALGGAASMLGLSVQVAV